MYKDFYKVFVLLLLITPGFSTNVYSSHQSIVQFEERAERLYQSEDFNTAQLLLDSALTLARSMEDLKAVSRILVRQSFIYSTKSNYAAALDLVFQAESIRKRLSDQIGLAEVYNHIGAIYHMQKEYLRATEFYKQSLDIYFAKNMKAELGRSYNNLGALLLEKNEPLVALEYHRKSYHIWTELNDKGWMNVSNTHIGECYLELGVIDSAITYLQLGAKYFTEHNNRRHLNITYLKLGKAYQLSNELQTALKYCQSALDISQELGLINNQKLSCECLYNVYERIGNTSAALDYHKKFVALSDSIDSDKSIKELTRVEMDHAFKQRQYRDSLNREQSRMIVEMQHKEALAKERETRNVSVIIGIAVLLLSVGLYSRLRFVRRSKILIEKERERSEGLLLNILPVEIAEELKKTGKATARRFERVSILFTDFQDFTLAAATMDAEDLVSEINYCFTAFDKICESKGVEKIKTIGDAYMAAGGLPVPTEDSAARTVQVALEMQAFINQRKKERSHIGLPAFNMRVGIHTGPVVAGIVGVKKFQYDIWGDTVNTASRMESSGEIDKVNISAATYALVKDNFECEYRGEIEAKGKGKMGMYFVEEV